MRVAIIGAGAAGCFCAVRLSELRPEAVVEVFEAAARPMVKLSLTGGGRCNLTNTFRSVRSLSQVYPRGERLMARALKVWDQRDVMRWFEQRGVALVEQADDCVFPRSQDAGQVVQTLLAAMRRSGVALRLGHRLQRLEPQSEGYVLHFAAAEPRSFDAVVVCTGGAPTMQRLQMLSELGLEYVAPVPSLFTFCISDPSLCALSGAVVEPAGVSLVGTRFRAEGALLFTHWGVSGPAILKLSSYAARWLSEHDYRATLCVNWLGAANEDTARSLLLDLRRRYGQRLISSAWPECLTARHWALLVHRCGLDERMRWNDLSGRLLNRMVAVLTSDTYPVSGKYRHKEEFVTCGGVSLASVQLSTLEAKAHPHLYFAGEVLDVDAITGGFNLQAAWSMAEVVARGIAANSK